MLPAPAGSPRLGLPPLGPPERRRHGLASSIAFALLGLYGVLRWGTMLRPDPSLRLLGMLALSLVVLAIGSVPWTRRLPVALLVAVIGVLAIVAIAGLPLEWVTHLRIAVTVRAVGQGLSALPSVLVPYEGIDNTIRAVIIMGAGVLLLDGALMLAFAPRSLGAVRPAVAALPLVVLAVVPSALARPSLPYVHGVLLFVLLAVLVWGDRIGGSRGGAVLLLVIAAGIAGGFLAPALDPHRPWLDVQKLASTLAGPGGERFDWAQSYGPLDWPQNGHSVFEVQARRRAYWKTEDLDTFNGYGWTDEQVQDENGLLGVSRAARRRYTQTIHVTLTGMSTQQVIAAGEAEMPDHVRDGAVPGSSPGTWLAGATMRPGDSYTVSVYTPTPTAAEMGRAGTRYPRTITADYLDVLLPAFTFDSATGNVPIPSLPVDFARFGARSPIAASALNGYSHLSATELLGSSPYGQAYRLARHLLVGAATPYAYALAIEHYLASGFRYDQHTVPSRYPLERFLFVSHLGYCQQFAGSMALLLRMGGVPARVATGFTTGAYDSTIHGFSVSDLDAHAWVEAWFPGYGWVTFDPTPAADPALGGGAAAASAGNQPSPSTGLGLPSGSRVLPHASSGTSTSPSGGGASGSGGASAWPWIGAGLLALLLLAALGAWRLTRAADDPVAELERAFRRTGRPLAPGTTLAALERRFSDAPEASGYVRALRMARYGAGPVPGPPAQSRGRRAMRRELAGRGLAGRLRALWALPPEPPRRPSPS